MATQQMSSYYIHVRTTDGKGNTSVSENIDSKAAVELIDKKTYEAERAK